MILDKKGIAQLLNFKNPYRKIEKRTFPFFLFLFLFITNFVLNVSFVLPNRIQEELELGIGFLVLGTLVILTYVLVSLKSPGSLRP
jgi:hypothetical protein